MISREPNIGQKETIYVRSKLIKFKELEYGNKAKMKHLLNLKLQDIQDKKQERITMRIGVNKEMKQDINKAQLNLTKP